MLQKVTVSTLTPRTTDEVIEAYFREVYSLSAYSIEEVLVIVDDWWHVPRSRDAVCESKARIADAVRAYTNESILPLWCHDAYAYALSEKRRDVLTKADRYRGVANNKTPRP